MLEAIFSGLINMFFWIIGIIGSIVIYPIQAIIVTIFPSLGEFITITLNFFNQQIFPLVSFVKDAFLYITGLPNELWLIFVGFVISRYAIAPGIRAIKFLINIWKVYKGTI